MDAHNLHNMSNHQRSRAIDAYAYSGRPRPSDLLIFTFFVASAMIAWGLVSLLILLSGPAAAISVAHGYETTANKKLRESTIADILREPMIDDILARIDTPDHECEYGEMFDAPSQCWRRS